MRRGIERTAHHIAGFGDNFVADRHHRANRNLAGSRRGGGKIERPAHRDRKRKAHAPRLAPRARAVSYFDLFSADWLCAGSTLSVGTFTVASVEPTLTVPVSTSKDGV